MNHDDRTVVGRPGAATLTVNLPDGTSFVFQINPGRVVVGRSPECDLVLEDASVSRRHAEINLTGQTLAIADLGSANGVVVNEQKVNSADLRDGDAVTLGTCRISVFLPSEAQDPIMDDRTVIQAPTAGGRPQKAAGGGAGGGRKRLYLVGGATLGVMLILIIIISSMGGEEKKDTAPPAKATTSTQPAKAAVPTTDAKTKAPATTVPATSAKAPAAPQAAQPSVPAATDQQKAQALKHLEQGRVYLEGGRLLDAEAELRKAHELDPSNELAALKLKKTQEAINSQAQEAFGRGMKNFQYLKYHEAIAEWVKVTNLLPDPKNPLHLKAAGYIAQAQAKLKSKK